MNAMISTPQELPARQQRALNLLAGGERLYRHGACWGRGISSVAGDVVRSLISGGLVRVALQRSKPEIVLTYSGRCLQAILADRRRQA